MSYVGNNNLVISPSQGTDELKRRNGFYINPANDTYYPSVTSILDGIMDQSGLLGWYAECGAVEVVFQLKKMDSLSRDLLLEDSAAVNWAKDQSWKGPKSTLRLTAGLGSRIHSAIESTYYEAYTGQGSGVDLAPDEALMLKAFRKLYSDTSFVPIEIERPCFYEDDHFRFAGKFDLVADIIEKSIPEFNTYLKKSSPSITAGVTVIDYKTGFFDKKKTAIQLAAYMEAYNKYNSTQITQGLCIHIPRKQPGKISCFFYPMEEMEMAFKAYQAAYYLWLYSMAPLFYLKNLDERN